MPRILLIEDNENNRDLMTRYLEYLDCEVISESNGPAGIARARQEHESIDVILMDMNLPGLDGWEVARRLKANELTQSIPLMTITAHAMVGDREAALRAGCDEYATKPIDFQELIEKIHTLIGKAALK